LSIDPLDKALLIAQGMEKRRALDVMLLDMRELMTITDYFIICHGRSLVHVEAIAESIGEFMEQNGIRPDHKEGGRGQRWVILDYGSAVAHIFTEDARDFYDLERLWEEAPVVEHQPTEAAATGADDDFTESAAASEDDDAPEASGASE
jgi:ribosome-associated protein